ncbi:MULTISPECIES: DUF4397 domain-containing protein [Bacillus]|uniref:DUF4397 domain-containing protein n=1 Tax=Bacillus TaxID=1386 RepID=UPI002243BD4D|nr:MULTISPECIES: DUF4397 domain-containing protein [Bacillus]MDN5386201.1 DUF4397 domain-containing protein [Bacillus sp. LB7]MEC1020388.1 DUF4397 domain-containing protein [Bacillus paralicheniformis]MEC1026457.1 DUF4397 domain-containing protein [Bacillus paralicheniformis]MEC1036687.1 DUF4397 domain-containing protein [Bacillus paralicheniformis]MEC1052866.1 DUF4397 domain-containing protein [Bacillus paralicheniformis]
MFSTDHDARQMAEGFRWNCCHLPPAEAPFYFRDSGKAAMIRLLHAAPHTDNLDVFVNGISVFQNVSYTDLSSYVRFPAGRIQIDVFQRGRTHGPMLTVQYHLIHGGYCTVAVTGTAAKLVPVGMYDRPAADPESRSIRCVHLSPDSPALDFAVQNGPVLFSGVPFQTVTRYIEVRSQKIDMELKAAGSTAVLLKVPKITLHAGESATLYGLGFVNGSPSLTIKAAPFPAKAPPS